MLQKLGQVANRAAGAVFRLDHRLTGNQLSRGLANYFESEALKHLPPAGNVLAPAQRWFIQHEDGTLEFFPDRPR